MIATIRLLGLDTGKNFFHIVGQDANGSFIHFYIITTLMGLNGADHSALIYMEKMQLFDFFPCTCSIQNEMHTFLQRNRTLSPSTV